MNVCQMNINVKGFYFILFSKCYIFILKVVDLDS